MLQNMIKRLRPSLCNIIKINKEYQRSTKSTMVAINPQKSSGQNQIFLMSGLLTWLGITSDPNADHDSNLVTTVKRGILASQEGDFKRAQQILHLALRQANEFDDQAAINHIFCLLAEIAIEMNLFGEAERLYIEVMKRIITGGEAQDSNAIVEMSVKLANIRVIREDFENAGRFSIKNFSSENYFTVEELWYLAIR